MKKEGSGQDLKYRKLRKDIRKTFEKYTVVRATIFFLDVFLALMIITAATVLIRTAFGRVTLAFGFFMMIVTLIFWYQRKW
jgi:steroid 5-alpha reductase family enzyme